MSDIGTISDAKVHEWLQTIAEEAWVSLHFDSPALDGAGGSEIHGGGYTRCLVDFTQPSNRTIWSLTDAKWTGLTQNLLTHFGIYTVQTGGIIAAYGPLPRKITVLNGQGHIIRAGNLAVSLF